MYTPAHFSEADKLRIAALIDEYGFATLISAGAGEVQVTHAPLMLDRSRGLHGTLVGHIAAANPHALQLVDSATALAIFHGPHGYISPTWYRDENPRVPNVPTWNYAAIHVHGVVRRIDDPVAKWQIVADLAARYEQGSASPWNPGALAAHAAKLGAIIGFEIAIDHIEAKLKLSQNRSVADQENVIAKLERGSHPDGHAMARLMRENLARKPRA